MKQINNILLNETVVQPVENVQSPQNTTLKGTAVKSANPKRSKTIMRSININLLKIDQINFYKKLISEITYLLITSSNYKKASYNNYKRFFYSIFKILNKYSNKSSKYKLNKNITKIKIVNIISYNDFITYICEDFNNTFYSTNFINKNNIANTESQKQAFKDINKNNKINLSKFYNNVLNAYIKLISK